MTKGARNLRVGEIAKCSRIGAHWAKRVIRMEGIGVISIFPSVGKVERKWKGYKHQAEHCQRVP